MDPGIYKRMAEVEDEHWWFSARRDILEKIIETLKLRRDAAILEVGCGTGGNLPMLARHGRVFGLESEPMAIDFARKRGCATIDQGWLPEDIPFAPLKFDLCVMTDVLEHLEQEIESLAAIRRGSPRVGHCWSRCRRCRFCGAAMTKRIIICADTSKRLCAHWWSEPVIGSVTRATSIRSCFRQSRPFARSAGCCLVRTTAITISRCRRRP